MLGLYVHIPFCVSKCHYCDFYSEAGKLHLLDDYLKALLTEAEQYRGLSFDTLYIGGGTPSLLGAAALEEMMRGLSGCCDFLIWEKQLSRPIRILQAANSSRLRLHAG